MFDVQLATNLASGNWTNVGQVTIGSIGYVIYTNEFGDTPPPLQYYRTKVPEVGP